MQTKQHTCLSSQFIETLLGREPIGLDPQNSIAEIRGRHILITGAAGTIGSGLARYICTLAPASIILIDHSESALYDLDQELREDFPRADIHTHVANITDALRMATIFSQSPIQIIFHAAAYKHVPFMESQPYEAIKTNILGTGILADLAISYRIAKFVFISTDKAIRPASVMGATKRFAEIYLQYLSYEHAGDTRFIITRFGNVLGSNGSFLLRFASQIVQGGPVTVTHPDAERYVMTVGEACRLVLEATATSAGDEILTFDMGMPVRIIDIARKMIEVANLRYGKDIQIVFTGLRPGDKLTEAPASEDFTRLNPHGYLQSSRFSASQTIPMRTSMSALQQALDSGQPERMVAVLKSIIPEYVSVNSPFCKLDTEYAKVV